MTTSITHTATTTTNTNTRVTAKQQQPHTLRCRQQHRYDARAAHCSCIAARLTAGTEMYLFTLRSSFNDRRWDVHMAFCC
uniref:Uncharacterized protein n=1 Tax=Elaeophora elaphi TaxID=1147741 RepID=A0A0R3RUW4_9BILA